MNYSKQPKQINTLKSLPSNLFEDWMLGTHCNIMVDGTSVNHCFTRFLINKGAVIPAGTRNLLNEWRTFLNHVVASGSMNLFHNRVGEAFDNWLIVNEMFTTL